MPDYLLSTRRDAVLTPLHDAGQELSALWEQLLGALESGNKPRTAVAVLTFVYYWYNFMPLARGTAVSGYITLLSLFMAAGMPVTEPIPKVRGMKNSGMCASHRGQQLWKSRRSNDVPGSSKIWRSCQ